MRSYRKSESRRRRRRQWAWVRGRQQRTLETPRLDPDETPLDALAQAHGGLSSDVLLEEVLLHPLERFLEVVPRQGLAAHDVSEQAGQRAEARPHDTARGRSAVGFPVAGRGEDRVDFVVEVAQHKLSVAGLPAPRFVPDRLLVVSPCCGVDVFVLSLRAVGRARVVKP